MSSPYFVQDMIKLKRNIVIFYLSDAHVYSKNVLEKEKARPVSVERGVTYSLTSVFFILIWSPGLFNENNFTVKSEVVLNIQLL